MIEYKQGNLLEADAEALVNTVNSVGIMGKGIALQFKQAFPENFRQYQQACKAGAVMPGRMFVFATGNLLNPKYIINFPTKQHWKGKSHIKDIQSGLAALIQEVQRLNIHSIAVPPLGCGNGGLDWGQVRPLIERAFAQIPDVQVLLFTPDGAPDAATMPIATKVPSMSYGRALLIKLLNLYRIPGYKLSLLEVQKLAYFLQVAGQPLKLDYVKHKYGPYAENLNHPLQRIEGHFIRGYGDRSTEAEIYVLPEAEKLADQFLANDVSVGERLRKVSQLIEGFETPYGMELLATVHWVATEEPEPATNAEAAVAKVHAWSARKRETFIPKHIHIAWDHLYSQGWLTPKLPANT